MILSTHLFSLLNLSTTPQFCPPLLLAYTFDVLDLIRQHNQPNIIRYLLCVIYYALCTVHYSLCTMHYALCTIHYSLCTMYYVLCTMHCVLCIIHYVLCIIYYALCIMYYALCTMHYALFTMHYALCIMHYGLCIRIYTYSYVFTILYVFIRMNTYLLFQVKIRRNLVILVLTRSSRCVE